MPRTPIAIPAGSQFAAEPADSAAKACPLSRLITYALGECANSLVMNGIFGFAMLYYTKALGLDPSWAGIAMSVSVFWEAFSEPVMGHISDNTRSRWGQRHPYMLFGGLLMAACCYLIWAVPGAVRTNQVSIFWYLVGMNLLLRTGLTMFFIPYMALGFELCTDYQGRSRLQGVRQIFNMLANFAGPAMAWALFFQDKAGVRGTTVPANYLHMGAVFATATAVFVLIVVAGTFHLRRDSRTRASETGSPEPAGSGDAVRLKARSIRFLLDLKQMLLDFNARWVIIFIFVGCVGTVLVSSLQIFVYDDLMRFSANEKTIAHGSTMVGAILGGVVSMWLAQRFDKRGAVLFGSLVSIGCNGMLALLFVTGLVSPGTTWLVEGQAIPLALCLFIVFHAGYWMGSGIAVPVATAMMADISEIHFLQTGLRKDGGYSSVFSLAMRLAYGLGLLASGYCLRLVGYKMPHTEATIHAPEVVWRLGMLTFVGGALICLVALLIIRKYPVTRRCLEDLRAAKGAVV